MEIEIGKWYYDKGSNSFYCTDEIHMDYVNGHQSIKSIGLSCIANRTQKFIFHSTLEEFVESIKYGRMVECNKLDDIPSWIWQKLGAGAYFKFKKECKETEDSI